MERQIANRARGNHAGHRSHFLEDLSIHLPHLGTALVSLRSPLTTLLPGSRTRALVNSKTRILIPPSDYRFAAGLCARVAKNESPGRASARVSLHTDQMPIWRLQRAA